MTESQQCFNELGDLTQIIDRPLIFPGRVSHTRLFPKFHAFSYSYLMVGIPIKPPGKRNSIISVDASGWRGRGWLCVNSEDHLHRGDDESGIQWKLDQYLLQQVCRILNERQ